MVSLHPAQLAEHARLYLYRNASRLTKMAIDKIIQSDTGCCVGVLSNITMNVVDTYKQDMLPPIVVPTTSEASPRCNYTPLRFLPWNKFTTKLISRRKTRSEGPVTLEVPLCILRKWSNSGTLNMS